MTLNPKPFHGPYIGFGTWSVSLNEDVGNPRVHRVRTGLYWPYLDST